MPSLGADMEAGKLVEWHVKPGDRVKRGDVVALVETEKGLIEVEIWENGVVDAILVQPGAKVPVGTVLATLHDGVAPAVIPPPPPTPRPPVVRASPAAKQLARELGVDLARLHGTGPHESITREDVARAAPHAEAPAPPPPSPSPSPSPGLDMAAMRRAIAKAMARSKREIPHYYLATDVDVSAALAWLAAENERRPVTQRLVFATLLLKAAARAIADVPEMNGFFDKDEARLSKSVHVGVAISLRQGGLVAPAIHDTERKSLGEIQDALVDLVARARAGRLRSSEMTDPTITVTNLGDQGVETVFGVIYPPQVALVGFGRVVERPWAMNGMIGVRTVVTATLAADHRVSDGHRGGVYLASIARLLQKPEEL